MITYLFIFTGNVHCVLVRGNQPYRITKDHTPNNEKELKRVLKSGKNHEAIHSYLPYIRKMWRIVHPRKVVVSWGYHWWKHEFSRINKGRQFCFIINILILFFDEYGKQIETICFTQNSFFFFSCFSSSHTWLCRKLLRRGVYNTRQIMVANTILCIKIQPISVLLKLNALWKREEQTRL